MLVSSCNVMLRIITCIHTTTYLHEEATAPFGGFDGSYDSRDVGHSLIVEWGDVGDTLDVTNPWADEQTHSGAVKWAMVSGQSQLGRRVVCLRVMAE